MMFEPIHGSHHNPRPLSRLQSPAQTFLIPWLQSRGDFREEFGYFALFVQSRSLFLVERLPGVSS
jgi:hypothetical protein